MRFFSSEPHRKCLPFLQPPKVIDPRDPTSHHSTRQTTRLFPAVDDLPYKGVSQIPPRSYPPEGENSAQGVAFLLYGKVLKVGVFVR